jgi:HAD superfamily hydrolase (TIGR01490 family)
MPTDVPPPTPREPTDRPIIAFFDVDNTLLRGASVFQLGKGAFRKGLITVRDILLFGWHQVRFLAVGENGKHMSRARERALELVGGHKVAELTKLSEEIYDRDIQPKLWPETLELAREHQRKGHEVWLISATPLIMGEVIARKLGLTGALGTVIEHVDGVFTGNLVGSMLHGEEKAVAAAALVKEKGASLADCWAYSDSRNDIPLLTLVGNRTVVNPDVILARHARQEHWNVLQLNPSSIRQARRRVKNEARISRRAEKPNGQKKSAKL